MAPTNLCSRLAQKQQCNQFSLANTALQKNVTDLQSEVETLKAEIASLKDRVEKALTASAGKELDGTMGTGEERYDQLILAVF